MSRRTIVLSVYVPTLLLAFGQGMLLPTLPIYAQSLGFSFAVVGLIVAAAGIGTIVADVPTGMILERLGRKPAMIIGTASLAVASLGLALAVSFPELMAFRLISGIGTALWNISRMAYLTDAVPIAQRGRALSAFGGVSRIGTFAGPAIGGVMAAQFGLQAPIYGQALMAAIATVISIFFVTESRRADVPRHAKKRWGVIAQLAVTHRTELATAGSAQIFVQMIRSGRQIVVPLYAAGVLGLDVVAVGTIVSISAAIDMSLFIPAGFVMDRLGRKFATVPAFIVMGLGMLAIPFAADYWGLLFATGLLGLGNGMSSGAMMTLGADLAPREATGEFLGLWRLIGDIGTAGGPLLVGGIAGAVGLGLAAIALSGVGFLAALTLTVFVKETLSSDTKTVHQHP